MTRTEAISRLNSGKMVTHREIAMIPLVRDGGYLYYIFGRKKIFAVCWSDFWMSKQNVKWDANWVDVPVIRHPI